MDKLIFPEEMQLNIPKLITSYIKCDISKQDEHKSYLRNLKESREIQNNSVQPMSASPLYFVDVLKFNILCEGENIKTKVEVFLSIKEHELNFLPGDSIGILPENSKEEVDAILNFLDLSEIVDECLVISLIDSANKKKLPPYIPKCITPRDLLTTCLDLRSIVKKLFIRSLVEYTGDSKEKRRLEELCSREGALEYDKYILQRSMCLLDILQVFPSCKPPLSTLIEHLPRLMPRAYSIASSPLLYPEDIRIVFNLVKDTRGRNGLCTNWLYNKICSHSSDISQQLQELHLSDQNTRWKVPIFLRKSSKFRLPDSLNSSLIMIGPGTGVAPFIGFLEHRSMQLNKDFKNCDYLNILLFGCRYKEKDYIFKKEIEKFKTKQVLTKLMECFSRENTNDSSTEIKYVQDLFQKEKPLLINLLFKEDTYLFICGDALNMAKDVEQVIIDSIADVKGISRSEATHFLQNLEKQGRYVKDVWR